MASPRLIAALLAVCGGAAACSSPDACAYHVGEHWLAFASAQGGNWDIHLVKPDGTCRHAVATDPAVDLSPAWAPHGVLAFESDRAPRTSIWLLWPALDALHRLDVGDLRAMSPSFSPDGARLAFEGKRPGAATGGIYVVPVSGGTPTLLTPEEVPHANGGPVFAPDGTKIYFVSDRSGAYEVHAVPVAGGAAVQITTGSGIIGRPAISPDGATLAFARVAGGSTEVVLFDLAGGTTRSLGVPRSAEPAFAPGGGWLAARVLQGSAALLDLLPLSAGASVPLTAGPGPDGAPAFTPEGP